MEFVLWSVWMNAILAAASELEEAGFDMSKNPLTSNEVFHNVLALSGAEWRAGNNVIPEKGPGMGRSALHDEESYSPLQINMATWGKDTSDVDVTVINSPYVEEFQNITKEELIDLITTDPKLAAKAGLIVLNSKNGYDNWTTWDAFVNNPDTPAFLDYAEQFSNDPDRGIPEPSETFDPTEGMEEDMTTTNTTVPPTTTTTVPDVKEPSQPERNLEYESQVPGQAPSFEQAQYDTRIDRLRKSVGSMQDEFPIALQDGYKIGIEMLEKQVNKQRQELGLNPLAKQDVNQVQRNTVRQSLLDALDLLGG